MPALSEFCRAVKDLMISDIRRSVYSIAPKKFTRCVRSWKVLTTRERYLYFKLRVLRVLGAKSDHVPKLPTRVSSILFVCHGNIIRSPMAAALLRKSLPDRSDVSIASAGLHGNSCGGVDSRAATVAREFGIILDEHRAQQLTPQLVESSDAIFVMDRLNEAKMITRFPHARSKVCLLGAFDGWEHTHAVEISDPYDQDITAVRQCYKILQTCVSNLARHICSSVPNGNASEQTTAHQSTS